VKIPLNRLLFVVPLLLACAVLSPTPAPTELPPVTQFPNATPTPPAGVPTETLPAPTAAVEPTALVDGVAPAEGAAMQALANAQGIPLDQITLVSTEAVDWPNGCLGVEQPGVACTEAIVPGFRIILAAGDQEYEYHTNQDGSLVVAAVREFAALRLVVRGEDGSLKLLDTGYALLDQALLNQGLMPLGGAVGETAYVLNLAANLPEIVRLDEGGTQPIAVSETPSYALAVWPGTGSAPARLAFSISPTFDNPQTKIFSAAPDGSDIVQVLIDTQTQGTPPFQFLAQRWSLDGQSLYFSREPYGIGGYIPFNGASSLFRYDFATDSVTQLVPFELAVNMLCLGDFDLRYQRAVGNCTDLAAITVYDVSGTGPDTTITPPAEAEGFDLLGTAHLSPEGGRVAFALARGDPENEQGAIAVSDGLSGAARLVLTSDPGSYYTLAGWLDDSTLLLQQQTVVCADVCPPSLWTVGVDGSSLTKLADGTFVAFAPGP